MSSIIKPALTLLIVTAVAGLLLGAVYDITKEPIEVQQKLIKDTALKEIITSADNFEVIEADIPSDSNITEITAAYANGEIIGYIASSDTKGYSGNIKLLVGILTNENKIAGVRILEHSETPGLGANAKNDKFYSQYTGKAAESLSVSKNAQYENEIQAITSATITTKAVTNGVNEVISSLPQIVGGGN